MSDSVFLLDESLPVPAADVGRVMQGVLGGVAYDHIRAVNTRYGWIARGLSRDQALELVDALKAAGHDAIRKAEKALVGIEKTLRVRRAALDAGALRVEEGLLGELTALPWAHLSLISIGRVHVERKKTVTTTKRKVGLSKAGLAMGVPMPTLNTTTTTRSETQLDEALLVQLVFAEDGVVREVRPSQFDYGYLGDRLRQTSRENFVLFLADLATHGSSATWTAMSLALAEEGTPPHLFQTEQDMLRFTQWRVEVSYDLED